MGINSVDDFSSDSVFDGRLRPIPSFLEKQKNCNVGNFFQQPSVIVLIRSTLHMWLFYWFIVTTIDCFHPFFSQEENAKLLRSWTAWLRTKKVHILERFRNITGLWGFYDRFINRCERRELRRCDPMIKCGYVLAIRFKSLQRDQCQYRVKTPLWSVWAFSLTWPTSMQI